MKRLLAYPALLVACFAYGALVVPHSDAAAPAPKHGDLSKVPGVIKYNWRGGHASDSPPMVYPDTPCNLIRRMDIAIVDGMLWECTCVRLLIGYQCDWMLIAGVTASRPIKRNAWHLPTVSRVPA